MLNISNKYNQRSINTHDVFQGNVLKFSYEEMKRNSLFIVDMKAGECLSCKKEIYQFNGI